MTKSRLSILRKELRKLKRDTALQTAQAVLRYPNTLRKRAAYRQMLELEDTADRFQAIYEGGLWHSREAGSGQGSETGYTEALRKWLPGLIEEHGIESIVDAPCGDFNWMRLVLPKLDVDYAGFDLVAPVIARNRERYAGDGVRFGVADICRDPLPACDLLLVRDCLFHLSQDDIGRFLKNIASVDYRFLLTSTHKVGPGFKNTDIRSGDFRILDLFDAPYGFPEAAVIDRLDDFPPGYPIERELVLLKKADVPRSLLPNDAPRHA